MAASNQGTNRGFNHATSQGSHVTYTQSGQSGSQSGYGQNGGYQGGSYQGQGHVQGQGYQGQGHNYGGQTVYVQGGVGGFDGSQDGRIVRVKNRTIVYDSNHNIISQSETSTEYGSLGHEGEAGSSFNA